VGFVLVTGAAGGGPGPAGRWVVGARGMGCRCRWAAARPARGGAPGLPPIPDSSHLRRRGAGPPGTAGRAEVQVRPGQPPPALSTTAGQHGRDREFPGPAGPGQAGGDVSGAWPVVAAGAGSPPRMPADGEAGAPARGLPHPPRGTLAAVVHAITLLTNAPPPGRPHPLRPGRRTDRAARPQPPAHRAHRLRPRRTADHAGAGSRPDGTHRRVRPARRWRAQSPPGCRPAGPGGQATLMAETPPVREPSGPRPRAGPSGQGAAAPGLDGRCPAGGDRGWCRSGALRRAGHAAAGPGRPGPYQGGLGAGMPGRTPPTGKAKRARTDASRAGSQARLDRTWPGTRTLARPWRISGRGHARAVSHWRGR
jgi:hypothetical protein